MYSFTVLSETQQTVATLLVNDGDAVSIVTHLLDAPSLHGWLPVALSGVQSGELEFKQPEDSADKMFCFGTKFPDLVSTAIMVHEGYRVVYQKL